MPVLEVCGLSVRYGNLDILNNISLTLNEGDWLMVCGPNGAGKSTLVKAMMSGIPHTGEILFNGKNSSRMKQAEIARCAGVLAQSYSVGYAFTVEEVVRLGRYAHSSGFWSNRNDSDDSAAVLDAIQKVGLEDFRKQSVMTLSGGELQRTFLAQVFAQNPGILILDEPTNHLDLSYQQRTFELIKEWLSKPGRAVISVVHDLNLAKAYGSSVILLNNGTIAAEGTPDTALTPDILSSVYGIDVYGWMKSMLSQWMK